MKFIHNFSGINKFNVDAQKAQPKKLAVPRIQLWLVRYLCGSVSIVRTVLFHVTSTEGNKNLFAFFINTFEF